MDGNSRIFGRAGCTTEKKERAMEPDFWRERWRTGQIGFHRDRPNPLLVRHHGHLPAPPSRVLVPLCGKSVDLRWLADRGHEVVGVELVAEAAEQFFHEQGLSPQRTRDGDRVIYEAGPIVVVVGDFFEVTPRELGTFDGVWDRAALVALPPPMRARYAPHLHGFMAPGARMLLVTYAFDGPPVGPPFAVEDEEVERLHGPALGLTRLESLDILDESPHFRERGVTRLEERVWLGRAPG
jgi:thiopurine S-methyltransferase